MAETPQKRLREETHEEISSTECNDSTSKRQKPYNSILSLLDEEGGEEQDLTQDLSAIFSTLQQELSSDSNAAFDFDSPPSTVEPEAELPHQHHLLENAGSAAVSDLDEDVKSVMRHLLEASDDELGIPNRSDVDDNIDGSHSNEIFPFAFADQGLWELEDEAANYYTVMQSELFM